MSQSQEPGKDTYPIGRGYGNDYMRGGEVLGGYGYSDRVEYVEDDYRSIRGHYDAFVSVGMLEHVGVENYQTLGQVARNALKENGRGLIHSIGRNWPGKMSPWIEKRIFPGVRYLFPNDGVRFTENVQPFPRDFSYDPYGEARPRKGMPFENVLNKAQLPAHFPHLVLEKLP